MKLNRPAKMIALLILIFCVLLRVASFPHQNADTVGYIRWYDQIAEHGFRILSTNFAVYTPPYLYLLWAATLFKEVVPALLAIKLIPTLFDILSAFAVYKLIKLKYPQEDMPYLGAAGFLLLPTVLVNSSYWGEIDSLYMSFLLFCIYFLLTDRPLAALLIFGLSISIKAQAAFLVPFLVVLAFKKRIPWSYFLIPPFVYSLMIVPVVLAGRPLMDALTIYVSQANTNYVPSMNAPNLYALTIYPPYYVDWATAIHIGFVIAAISIISWVIVSARRKYELDQKGMILSMLACLALVPYVLPKMHDRYFYPADVLSFIFAFYYPAYWFMPLLFQGASGIMYYVFLASVDPSRFHILFPIAAAFSTLAVVILLIKQHREIKISLED
jgi:Gpi18-like mannosyltransferase